METAEELTIIEVEKMNGNVLIYFSNGISVLFQAHFLWDVREHNGNVVSLDEEPEENGGPMRLPEE